MSNTIILKKSSVAGKVPLATDLQVGELAVNLADAKLYSKNSGGTVIEVGSAGGSGTVTSVGLSMPAQFSVSGSPVTTSGTLTAAWNSQTQNFVFAAPSSGNGVPTFRALVASDIPTLNQNTTGTAANVTGTVAVANGGTGSTTAPGARTNLGATTVGSNLFTLTNPSAITFPRFNADNTVSSLSAADFRTAIGAGTGNGTVTGVTATAPVASSGGTAPVISLASGYGDTQNPFASKTANFVYAAPNGTAGVPTFRALVAADIPTLNQNTTGTASNVTGVVAAANGGTGLSSPGTSGNVLTSNGTAWVSQAPAGGAVAGGAIYENTQTISSSYTMTSGRNGLSAGPVTVASGVTVTIPSGSVWVIV